MAIVSSKELFRKSTFEIGKVYQLEREWVCVLSDNAISDPPTELSIVQHLGIAPGIAHPTLPRYKIRKIAITEGHGDSPYHVHVRAEYGVVLLDELLSPELRAAQWDFDGTPGEVPAFYYYEGSGNGTLRPLTNSAYDYFQGLVTQESLIAAKVTRNYLRMTDGPNDWLLAQNCINNATYLGLPQHTWKVANVTVTPESEEFDGVLKRFWKCVAELHYRQSGHNYQLPDIGFNFLDGGQKQRCMVFDFQNDEWIPSPNPVGLNGSGAQTLGAPAILDRRLNPTANFTSLFGSGPTDPLPV